jgi:hypothetical protein
MSKKLTLQDRYYISMYSRRLQSTLKLRFAIDAFLQQLEITREETEKYEVGVDPVSYEFKCNNDTYTVEYTDFPSEVIEAINSYISLYDHEQNKDNALLHKTLEYLKKVI